jgi:Family of unknown function (DUF5343)
MTGTGSPRPASEEMRRPYAPPSHVVAVLKRARSRNLPDRITTDFLSLAGIPSPMAPRTTFALKFLGLTEDDGSPTNALHAIAATGESEYRELLAKAIRTAYAADFERIDPGVDNQKAIADAFARYQPRSQTSRMVMTFLGLCREAEIPVLEAPRKRELLAPSKRGERQARSASSKPQASARPRTISTTGPGEDTTLFAVSDSDIAVLGEEEFEEVWAALGKVARARARARHGARIEESAPDEGVGDEDDQ